MIILGGPSRRLYRADGSEVVVPPAADAYEAAISLLQSLFSLQRHEIVFHDFSVDAGLVFNLSPQLPAPAGFQWRKQALTLVRDPKRDILGLANALGFVVAGVTEPRLPARYTDRFERWLDAGSAAGMDFLQRQRADRLDPELTLSGAQSVIALGTPYDPIDTSPPNARVARYAQGRDYHVVIPKRLAVLQRFIQRRLEAATYVSVDTGAVLERAYAERAGIGWIGKNGMLISRKHGSYLFLATLWTTLTLDPDTPHEDSCGTCTACMVGCPTGAIPEPGWVESRRCLSYWTIEHRGEMPAEAPPLKPWIFGCDVCQEVCPWNRFAGPTQMQDLDKRTLALDWLNSSDEQIEEAIAQTPLRRAGAAGLRRNVLKIIQ